MNEYISRENVLGNSNIITVQTKEYGSIEVIPVDTIADIESADVQPVKHGRWSECYTDSHHYSGICTVCGKASIRSIKENPLEYCPKCGARMAGGIT